MSNDDPTQPLLSSNPNANASGPLPSPPIPFPNRVLDFLSVWTLKALFRAYTTLLHLLSLLRLRPRPSLVKTYPCAPHSPVRIFLPPKSNAGRPPPLLISIHGGGFALGHPIIDDPDAHLYATHHALAVAFYPVVDFALDHAARVARPTSISGGCGGRTCARGRTCAIRF